MRTPKIRDAAQEEATAMLRKIKRELSELKSDYVRDKAEIKSWYIHNLNLLDEKYRYQRKYCDAVVEMYSPIARQES